MAETKIAVSLQRNDQKTPIFFRKTEEGEAAFFKLLRRLGDEYRDFLMFLREIWIPNIRVQSFISEASKRFTNPEAMLDKMMSQARSLRYGLITLTAEEGKLKKNRIILTEKDSACFWYWVVENEWQIRRASASWIFPKIFNLDKDGKIPHAHIHPFPVENLSSAFADRHKNDIIIYTYPSREEKSLVVTPFLINILIEFSRQIIRGLFKEDNILTAMGKYMKKTFGELQTGVKSTDPLFWESLTTVISKHIRDIRNVKPNISEDFFTAAEILNAYLKGETENKNREKEENHKKDEILKLVLRFLRENKRALVSEKEFDQRLLRYRETWPNIKNDFTDKYMRVSRREDVPVILKLGDKFISRDKVLPFFEAMRKSAEEKLLKYYVGRAEEFLMFGSKRSSVIFSGVNAFRADIRQRLMEDFPIIFSLLEKPRLTSKCITHYVVNVQKISDTKHVKYVLAKYLTPGKAQFHPPDVLLKLSALKILKDAYAQLGFFNRFLSRLSGRYDTLLNVLDDKSKRGSGLFGKKQSASGKEDPLSENDQNALNQQSYESSGIEPHSAMVIKQKWYTKRQRDNAWKEFQKISEAKKNER